MVCWGILSLNAVGWLMCLMPALICHHHSNSCSLCSLVYLLLMIWTFWKLERASGSGRSQMGFLFAPVPLGQIWKWKKKIPWPLLSLLVGPLASYRLVLLSFTPCCGSTWSMVPIGTWRSGAPSNYAESRAGSVMSCRFWLQFHNCCLFSFKRLQPDRQLQSLFYLRWCAWVLQANAV